MLKAIALFILAVSRVTCVTIDNGVIGEPEVECGTSSMMVKLNTKNPFEGHVYVKGHYDTPSCRADASNNSTASLTVGYAQCDVRRQRTTSPAGVFLSAVIVVTFHPMFVTMVDRAYNVKCFYTTSDKMVSSDLEVSTLATEVITQEVQLPECKYEVLSDIGAGEAIKYATVGQQVYHKWSCGSDTVDVYCMTVHSCSVEDGQGRRVLLLDENGCPQDKYLMANLKYPGDLTAQVDSTVFKFADKPSLFFQCQIRLSLKTDGQCKRASDECHSLKRLRRDLTSSGKGENVDVFSDTLVVLDVDDGYVTLNDLKKLQSLAQDSTGRGDVLFAEKAQSVCMSQLGFGILMAIVGLLLLATLMISAIVCLRYGTAGGKR